MSAIGQCLAAFIFGSVVGVLVQRSRFCNTAALRDAMLFKTYRNTKALLVCMMILTIGFTAFITVGEGHTMHFDVGINQVLGLFLFGIGMVLAGACTVSTWVKAGEGNVGAIWALLFTFVGMFLFSLVWSFMYWPPAPTTMDHQPHLAALQFGYANAATLQAKTGIPAIVFGLVQFAVLFAIYRAILRKEARMARQREQASATAAATAVAASPAPQGAAPVGATAQRSS
ncbi:MAG: YeeE/YedE thiosulfate transporter family protein [Gammaproteobacteria bacterium]